MRVGINFLEKGDRMKNKAMQDASDFIYEEYGLVLLTIKVQCPHCGQTWGIKLEDFRDLSEIPQRKFICERCYGNVDKIAK